MPSIGNVSSPASTINFPRIEPADPSRDGSCQCKFTRNGNRMSRRHPSVVPLKVFDDSPHDDRDRPPCHREVHVIDGAIHKLAKNWKSLE